MRIWATLGIVGIIAVVLFLAGTALYQRGYNTAEAIYQKKAVEAAMLKIDNTEALEQKKEQLKQREKNLNDDCKALYHTDLRACRQQLRRKN